VKDDDAPPTPDSWQIEPENVQAATTALARLLRLLGEQKKEPCALFGLHALIGATLLRYSVFTAGEMLDLMHEYAADDALIEAIGVVLGNEGILGVDKGFDAGSKPN
jgi:hypothetical protein